MEQAGKVGLGRRQGVFCYKVAFSDDSDDDDDHDDDDHDDDDDDHDHDLDYVRDV